jgi:hypothetical protein
LNWLRNLLSVRVVPTDRTFILRDDTRGAFVTPAALASFPVASGIVTVLWKILAMTGVELLKSSAGIAISAILVGLALWALTSTANGSWRIQLGEILIGVINTALLFAAAVGIDVTFLNGTGGQ